LFLVIAACGQPADVEHSADANALPGAKAHVRAELLPVLQAKGRVLVIVGVDAPFQPEGHLAATALSTQRTSIGAVQLAARKKLSAVHHVVSFETLPFMVMEVSSEAGLDQLIADPTITSIEEDAVITPALSTSTTNINANGPSGAWASGYDGTGYAVAIIDTGVMTTHTVFSGKVVAEACFSTHVDADPAQGASLCPVSANPTCVQTFANARTCSSFATGAGFNCPYTGGPTADGGSGAGVVGCDHGTHVANIAAGNDPNTVNVGGFINAHDGVARGANVVAIMAATKVLTAAEPVRGEALFYTHDFVFGLQRVKALVDPPFNMKIAAVNMSLGSGMNVGTCDSYSNGLGGVVKTAIDNLRSVNVATVIASGNSGHTNAIASPGCISSAVTVGATGTGLPNASCSGHPASSCGTPAAITTDADSVASFSNTSAVVDVMAPGYYITAAIPPIAPAGTNNLFAHYAGTSMAAPHVAGAFAVLRSAKSDMTVTEGENALISTGVPIAVPAPTMSKPRINLAAAIAALKVSTPALTPPGGTYSTPQSVVASTPTEGATLRCTIDNTPVTAGSPLCATMNVPAPSSGMVIRVRAFKNGLTSSDELSQTYTVACPAGYNPSAGVCVDINECLVNNGGCDALTMCNNTPGSRTCGACPTGYTGTGATGCNDINECLVNNGGCDALTMCNNTPGSRTCGACPSGYTGNGAGGCTDVNECLVNNGGCDALTMCTNTPGSRTCGACPTGYTGNGTTGCTDVNECLVNNGGCDALTMCTNTPGSRTCGACPGGYTGNGTAGCTDVNECLTSNGGCDALTTCTNTPGSRTCSACPTGYTGTGATGCTDINECLTSNGECDALTTCTNTPGARTCSACPSGYSGTGESGCADVDECATNNGGCSPDAVCANTAGGNTCTCATGFTGDGVTCVADDSGSGSGSGSGDGSGSGSGSGSGDEVEAPDSGCGCQSSDPSQLGLFSLALVLGLTRRRKRRGDDAPR
jgi:MYXO-CTERM domain-containing protein